VDLGAFVVVILVTSQCLSVQKTPQHFKSQSKVESRSSVKDLIDFFLGFSISHFPLTRPIRVVSNVSTDYKLPLIFPLWFQMITKLDRPPYCIKKIYDTSPVDYGTELSTDLSKLVSSQ